MLGAQAIYLVLSLGSLYMYFIVKIHFMSCVQRNPAFLLYAKNKGMSQL